MEKGRREREPNTSVGENRWQAGLFATHEGRILLVGLVLAALYFTWLAFDCPGVSEEPQVFMGMTATLVFLGRAAGMSFGYAMDIGSRIVVLFSMFIESVLVLLFYPLFVLAWQRLLVIKVLRNLMETFRKAAEAHHDVVIRFGIPGLMFFVWFPFFMTGPLVGSVIGFMLGLRTWVNLTVVLTGTYLAILSWAIPLRRIHERAEAYNPYAPVVLVVILILILVGVYLLRRTRRGHDSSKRRHRG